MDSVSPPSVLALASVCQVTAIAAAHWHLPPPDDQLRPMFDSLPAYTTLGERYLISGFFLKFLPTLATYVQRRFETRVGCREAPPLVEAFEVLDDDACPADTMVRWAAFFRERFAAAYGVSAGVRDLIDRDLTATTSAADLARQFGNVRSLQRRFKAETGESIAEYRFRRRLRAALMLLRSSDLKIEAIASMVGWRSKKDLYSAFSRVFNTTPARVRAASIAAAADAAELLQHPLSGYAVSWLYEPEPICA